MQDTTLAQTFSDVPAGAWYADAVAKASAAGIINGVGGGKMDPNGEMNREQFFTMFARAMGLKEQSTTGGLPADGSAWSKGWINALTDRGYVKGDGKSVNALAGINRASVAALLDQTISAYANTDGATVEASPEGITLIAARDAVVTGEAGDVVLTAAAAHGSLTIASGASVDTLIATDGADGVSIKVESGATVDKLVSEADNVSVRGSGAVAEAEIEGDNNKVNTKDTVVTASADATGTTAGNQAVSAGETATVTQTTGSSGGSSGGSGSGSPAPETKAIRVAFITEDIDNYSIDQIIHDTAKAWCEANGADYACFIVPSGDDSGAPTEDRLSAVTKKAIDEGYNVMLDGGAIVFGPEFVGDVSRYSDVAFIELDARPEAHDLPDNLYCARYQEELCGYMAGYAAVKLGYTKLGFLGGMKANDVPAYGYGFVRGADDAAAADGKTDVSIKYGYAGTFGMFEEDMDGEPSFDEVAGKMAEWYADGTEVVFSCGGNIYHCVATAAAECGGKVIGVDIDEAPLIDAYGEGMTVTSAMKGFAVTVNNQLDAVKEGKFVGGK